MFYSTWIIRNLNTLFIIIFINKLLLSINALDQNKCLDIKRYYNQKTGYTFKDAIELSGSNALLLRATSEGEGNFFTIIDASSHQVLHSFSIDSHLKQMIYCSKKNKLLTVSQDKLIERHLLQFDIIKTYSFPNIVMVEDIPYSENEVLILIQDQKAIRYDLFEEVTKGKHPIKMPGQKYPIQNQFIKLIILQKFNLYVRGGNEALEIYHLDGFPIGGIFTNDSKNLNEDKILQSDIVGIQGTQLVAFQHNLQEIIIWEIKEIELGVYTYIEKLKQNLEREYPYKLHFLSKNDKNYLVIFSSKYSKRLKDTYLEVNIYQIIIEEAQQENNIKVQLKLAEIWQNTEEDQQFSVLSLFPQSKRVFGIINNQHLSFELLEYDYPDCDYFDQEFGQYCRKPKILNFRNWSDSFGVFFLQDGNIMIPNSNQGILEIRDSQMKEVYIQEVQLKNINQAISRVFVTQKSNNRILENQNKLNKLDIFMWKFQGIYGEYTINIFDYITGQVKTFDFEQLFKSMPLKLKLNQSLVTSYVYKNKYIGCIAFSQPNVNNFSEDLSENDIQKIKELEIYFIHHNLECYEMNKDLTIQQHNLIRHDKMLKKTNIGGDNQTIVVCTLNEQMNIIICINNNSDLLYWDLENFLAKESNKVSSCVETSSIISSGDFVYLNCLNNGSIQQYNMKTNQIKIISKRQTNKLSLIKNGSLLIASTYQSAGFQIFDITQPENSQPIFQFEDKQVCCKAINIDFDENENNVIIMSKDALMIVNISDCKNNFTSCMKCTMEAYISHDSKFSYSYKKKDEFGTFGVDDSNPKLISIGNGTKEYPYVSDLQIIELYLKADVLKNLLTGFNQITIQIFFDSSKVNPLNRYFFDWTQEKSLLQIMSYQPTQKVSNKNLDGNNNENIGQKNDSNNNSNKTENQEFKFPPMPAFVTIRQKYEIKMKYWNSLSMHYINVICTECLNDLNITVSYMIKLKLYNVQFLTYEGDENDNIGILQELKRLKYIESNDNIEDIKKYDEPQIKNIFPTFYLKRINYTVIDQLQIKNLSITKPILNLISCQEVILKNMVFDSNVVSSEIVTSQQTFLSLQSINFTNNQFIHGKQDETYQNIIIDDYSMPPNKNLKDQQKNDTNKIIRNLQDQNQSSANENTNHEIEEEEEQKQKNQSQEGLPFDKDKITKDNSIVVNRTIILITFQNINANNLLIRNNTFLDHLFFQGFIENQFFSQKTNFIFQNIRFMYNKYNVVSLPRVLFIQILLEVFLIAQHDVTMKEIHIRENSQQYLSDSIMERKYESYYIQLSMIKSLFMENMSIKSESLGGLIETKMVVLVYIQYFKFNDKFTMEETLDDTNLQLENNDQINEKQQDSEKDNSQEQSDPSQDENNNEFMYPLRMFPNSLIKISETEILYLEGIEIGYLHFVNTIVINIFNKQKQLQSVFICDCLFYQVQINSLEHFIQVNLILINAESSFSEVVLFNNTFQNITLNFSPNSEMKSSSALTVFSLKSNTTLYNNLFEDMFTASAIGPLSFDVCSLQIEECQFINNIYGGLRVSESEISSLNVGGFIVAKVDQIFIKQTNFSNSFSTRGALFIKSSVEQLYILIKDTNFDYIFSFSSPGSAISIDSSQSFLKMNMTNCRFSNIVTINTQYTYSQPKSAIYIQKEYSAQFKDNTAYFSNIIIENICTQFYQKKESHFFTSFYTSFNSFFLMSSSINISLIDTTIISNRKDSNLIQFFKYIEQFKQKQFKFEDKILEETSFIHSTIFQVQYGLVTCRRINYLGQKEEVDLLQSFEATEDNFIEMSKLKKNLFLTIQTLVYLSELRVENLLTTRFIDIQESQDMVLEQAYFYNVEQIIFPNLISKTIILKLIAESIIELKKVDNLKVTKLEVYCDGVFENKESDQQENQNEADSQKVCLGQILFIQDSKFYLGDSIFSSYSSPIHNGTAVYIQNPFGISEVSQNVFVNLSSYNCGSAIYILIINALYLNSISVPPLVKNQVILNIMDNLFQQNAVLKQGGAIYFENIDPSFTSQIKFKLQQNKFIKNSAQLGSSLFYNNIVPLIDQLTNKFKQNNDYIDKASVFSTPHLIRIVQTDEILPLLNLDSDIYNQMKQTNSKGTDFIGDISVASGQKLPPLRFQLFYINSFSQEKKEVRLDLLNFKISIQDIIKLDLEHPFKQIEFNKNQIEQKDTVISQFLLKNKDDVKYDPKNNYIEFTNLQFFGPLQTNTTLYVSSPLIQYENKQLNIIDKNLTFKINIHFRPCNQFEIIVSSDLATNQQAQNISQCQKCLDQTFSKDQQICSECPLGAVCKYGQRMKIQEGYWRSSNDSYDIIQCYNEVENCKGGDGIGNELCKEGHIGALCEECDIFGEVWQYRYSHQGIFKCQRCDQLAISYIFILISHLLTLIIAISSIVSNSESIKMKTIKAIYKQSRKNNKLHGSNVNQSEQILSEENEDEEFIQSGASLKILASYFSIMSSMSNFKFSLPKIVPEVSSVVGSPIAISMNAIDCLLVQMPLSRFIAFIYFQYIIKILFPFILFVVILSILLIWNCVKKYKFQFHYIYTTILFLYIYLQPDLVYEAINLISCRQIAGINYILGNVSFQCSDEYKMYEFGLVYPVFICLVFIIPLCLLMKLIRNKVRLRKIRFQLRWGILYHEYIDQCYYWEFIKISEKLLIILTISIFNSYQNIQLGVLIVILLLYLIYLYKMQPFMKSKDNSMEFFSNFTILLTIKQIKLYESIIILVLLIFVNLVFILFISTKIYVEQYELFKQKKPELFLKCPKIDRFLNYLSQKLQKGWRNSPYQNNSFVQTKKTQIGSNRYIEKILPRKKIILEKQEMPSIQNQSFNIKSNQDQDGSKTYNNDSNQMQSENGSQEKNKNKTEFLDQDEVEEFNSFGYNKTSLKIQQDNSKNNNSHMINSDITLSTSNLDVSSNQMHKQQYKERKVPISEFQVKSQTSIQFNMNLNTQQNQISNNRSQMSLCNSLESIGGIVSKQSLQTLQFQQTANSSNKQIKSLLSNIRNVSSQNHINLPNEELQSQNSRKKITPKLSSLSQYKN